MVCTKASGQEQIDHTSHVVDNIGKHFNNPDISDVTLRVGEQIFAAHRFLLASQSSVFHTLLLSEKWRESREKTVTLEESTEGVNTAFCDFLKFFYTGKLMLTIGNVCAIHTLADKYDVPGLKEDCLGFMKDVLTGVHGDALEAGVGWLQYIESFVPDLVNACYGAIRNHLLIIKAIQNVKGKLNKAQIKNILTTENVEDEIVTTNEGALIANVRYLYSGDWASAKADLYPLFRFYHVKTSELKKFDEKSDQVIEAYRVKAELSDIVKETCKKRRLSDGSATEVVQCPCPENKKCLHINPRLYLDNPFGIGQYSNISGALPLQPVDLCDIKTFGKKLMYVEEASTDSCLWKLKITHCHSEEPIYESFTVRPADCHVGRQFTIAIACVACDHKNKQIKYTIKHTGKVEQESETQRYSTKHIALKSPLRVKGSWKPDSNKYSIWFTMLLHK